MSDTKQCVQNIRKLKFFEYLWVFCAIVIGGAGILIALLLDEPVLISTSLFFGFIFGAFCMVRSTAMHKRWRALRAQLIHEIVERDHA
jgi:hypothetical protein